MTHSYTLKLCSFPWLTATVVCTILYLRVFLITTMTYKRESSTWFNSLHNTKTTKNVLNIILWRLLVLWLCWFFMLFTIFELQNTHHRHTHTHMAITLRIILRNPFLEQLLFMTTYFSKLLPGYIIKLDHFYKLKIYYGISPSKHIN